jgi:haloalkane dehalogenase
MKNAVHFSMMMVPGRGPVFDLEPHRKLYPFKSNWWEHKDLRYHYIDEGEGDVILMLHGNPTWSFYYRELVKAFSDRYRVIVPDMMGCGLSDRPSMEEYDFRYRRRVEDIEAFMDHLGLEKDVTLVAHDWGGIIGSAVAGRNPEKFSRYIFLNTAGFRMPKGKNLPFRLWWARYFPVIPKIMMQGFNAFARFATTMGAQKKMSSEVKAGLLAPYNSWHNRLAIYRFVKDIALESEHPSYQMVKETDEKLLKLKGRPMLILWGKGDFIFDMDILEVWKQRFPEARVHVVEDAGHYIIEDSPDVVIREMENFLAEEPLKGKKEDS